ncbi:TPA: hypothetical protein ACF43J_001562 [Streptococcus pyogenes]|uniref:Phage protein n=2 Tax=Streptococcus pyogenes TaxID=1314 RepID=A0A8B6J106_STRPY|nr:hypothetical protein [Streptococcus pyogenes]HER4685965.1 hypothetical protein [Streptococcus pyogenes NGAS353]OAC54483.1 hypothetical protein AWT85_01355 [Streptococcus pyogenes]OAC58637.1 hypothetical protein AWU03_07750 [Streptococcus pyogenes]OAC61832.1 hypothetical protein AWU04_00720 [Streptococcus pyogenes]OAC67916.1 hypothetical protein AWT96_02850 [Streptococcus pyogenes]
MIMPLDELEKRIFCYLPIGSNMMVNSKEICRTFDIKDPKTLRDIIHGMVMKGYLIGSSRRKGGGYYLIDDDDERTEAISSLESQVRKEQKRINILKNGNLNEFAKVASEVRNGRN